MLVENFHAEYYPPGRLIPALSARAREVREEGVENVNVDATASLAYIVACRNREVVRAQPSAPPDDPA
ncbi:MAG: hypothetical protein M3Q49_14700 [Actinomycetota bacterium]|nr:hypothetical protein [Actinomycetota bacterium]